MKDNHGISQKILEPRMVGSKFQENNKSLESSSNFKTDIRQSLANELWVHDGSFVLEEESFLDSTPGSLVPQWLS